MHLHIDIDYIRNSRIHVAMFVANAVINDSRVLKTAQTVQKFGYNITVYGIGKNATPQTIDAHPFKIILLPSPKYQLIQDGLIDEYKINRRADLLVDIYSKNLYEILKDHPPDILHTHDMNGIAVGAKVLQQFSPSKAIAWIHDIHEYVQGLTDIPENNRKYFSEIESRNIKTPDLLSSVSPALNLILQGNYRLSRQPELVLNTPRLSDFSEHYKPDIRSVLGLSFKVPLLVYSGSVKPVRGVDTMIDAMALIPDVHLAIITNNSNSYVDELKKRSQVLEIEHRVHFLPYVPFFNVTSFLSGANVGIHPIHRYPNAEIALPNKLFEYIHAGLPIIVSDNPTMAEFVKNHDIGDIFKAKDHESLACQIDKVLERQSVDSGWKISILSLAEKYSWENQEEKIWRMYNGLGLKNEGNITISEGLSEKASILHLPAAAAGQPGTFSKELTRIGNKANSLVIGNHKFRYNADFYIDNIRDFSDFAELYCKQLKYYDIIHYHARPLLFKAHYPYPTGLDLILLRAAGKKVFYHFRGSELRMASVFKDMCPFNYVDENPDNIFSNYRESEQRVFRDYVQGVCHGVFVTDPELKSYFPEAMIMPRVVDLKDWPLVGVNSAKVVKILHAPSRRIVKGTDDIIDAVEKLREDGLPVDFRLIENMTHQEACENYRWADIIVDQLRIGWYGVLAVEAMALGKAVVAYIRDDLKHHLPFPFPLAIANPSNIYEVLRGLAENPDEMCQLGLRGRKYVENCHSAQRMAPLLEQAYSIMDNPLNPSLHNEFHLYQIASAKKAYKKKIIHATLPSNTEFSLSDRMKRVLNLFIQVTRNEGFFTAVTKAYKKVTRRVLDSVS